MTKRTSEEISRLARDGATVDRAIEAADTRTVERHRQLHAPLIVWRDGKVVEADVPSEPATPTVPAGRA